MAATSSLAKYFREHGKLKACVQNNRKVLGCFSSLAFLNHAPSIFDWCVVWLRIKAQT